MNISFEKLGAINKGEILLNRSLIVMTGPNNTGKSYITYLLHAILNSNTFNTEGNNLFSALTDVFTNSKFIKKLVQNNEPVQLEQLIMNHKNAINNLIAKNVEANYSRIFASSIITPKLTIEIDKFDMIYNETEIDAVTLVDGKLISILKNNQRVPSNISLNSNDVPDETKIAVYAAYVLSYDLTHKSPFGNSFIFPAERTAINLFARDIVAKKAGARDEIAFRVLGGEDIAAIANSIKEEQNVNPKYPLAINSYLNFVNSFEGASHLSHFSKIAKELEEKITGGTFSVSKFKQIVFTPKDSKQSLSLYESSSSVKSLSYLVIYLRYFATKGDWVIIDEPEINLHPDLQVAIARVFAKLIDAGLRMIISTHSDYFIKELNTLALLYDLNKDSKSQAFIKKQGYSTSELLDKSKVGAYYLSQGLVNPIDVESNGIVVPSINKTIDNIDNLTEEVSFKLKQVRERKSANKTKSVKG